MHAHRPMRSDYGPPPPRHAVDLDVSALLPSHRGCTYRGRRPQVRPQFWQRRPLRDCGYPARHPSCLRGPGARSCSLLRPPIIRCPQFGRREAADSRCRFGGTVFSRRSFRGRPARRAPDSLRDSTDFCAGIQRGHRAGDRATSLWRPRRPRAPACRQGAPGSLIARWRGVGQCRVTHPAAAVRSAMQGLWASAVMPWSVLACQLSISAFPSGQPLVASSRQVRSSARFGRLRLGSSGPPFGGPRPSPDRVATAQLMTARSRLGESRRSRSSFTGASFRSGVISISRRSRRRRSSSQRSATGRRCHRSSHRPRGRSDAA